VKREKPKSESEKTRTARFEILGNFPRCSLRVYLESSRTNRILNFLEKNGIEGETPVKIHIA